MRMQNEMKSTRMLLLLLKLLLLLLLKLLLLLLLELLLLLLLELLLLLQQLMLLLLSKLRMHSAGHHGQRLTLPGLAYACSHGR